MALACSPGEEGALGPSSLVTVYLLQLGILGEVLEEGLNRIFISFSGVSFQGSGLH